MSRVNLDQFPDASFASITAFLLGRRRRAWPLRYRAVRQGCGDPPGYPWQKGAIGYHSPGSPGERNLAPAWLLNP